MTYSTMTKDHLAGRSFQFYEDESTGEIFAVDTHTGKVVSPVDRRERPRAVDKWEDHRESFWDWAVTHI